MNKIVLIKLKAAIIIIVKHIYIYIYSQQICKIEYKMMLEVVILCNSYGYELTLAWITK